jgi:Domain of unknown function (DUF4917)
MTSPRLSLLRRREFMAKSSGRADKPIVEQIRAALDEEKYPLFVAEGTSASKKARILHSGYLHKAHRSLESCCGPAGNAIVIYGHSLADMLHSSN